MRLPPPRSSLSFVQSSVQCSASLPSLVPLLALARRLVALQAELVYLPASPLSLSLSSWRSRSSCPALRAPPQHPLKQELEIHELGGIGAAVPSAYFPAPGCKVQEIVICKNCNLLRPNVIKRKWEMEMVSRSRFGRARAIARHAHLRNRNVAAFSCACAVCTINKRQQQGSEGCVNMY